MNHNKIINIKALMASLIAILFLGFLITTVGCNQTTKQEEKEVEAKTPVTVTSISIEPMVEKIELNAISSFIKKSSVRSTVAGQIEKLDLNPGDQVKKGEILMVVRTKESVALRNYNSKDSAMHFNGLIKIRASSSGIVTSVTRQKGDNVMEGDEVAVIAEQSSLIFLLEAPYELHQIITKSRIFTLLLPDGREIKGTLKKNLPSMDAVSQTESFVIVPQSSVGIPENLIAKAQMVKSMKGKATVLPKATLLSNETQSAFWVMKMINDSVAVKVLVKKGIETGDKVEIIQPSFDMNERFLVSGNYGLPDTAKVILKK
jgi:biotin carboxyl carrier protein